MMFANGIPGLYNTVIVLSGTMLLGFTAGVVGALMLLRKRALVGDVVSHAALPGIGIGYLVGEAIAPGWGKTPGVLLVGAFVSGGCGLALSSLLIRFSRLKEDAALGMVLGLFFGFGVVLLTVIQRLPLGNAAGLNEFVFGKAAAMLASDVWLLAGISGAIGLAAILFFKEFAVLCFDPDFARAQGWPVGWLDLLLTLMVTLVTVAGLQSVGVLLVVAVLVLPPCSSRFWTDRLGPMTAVAGVLGAAGSAGGVLLSAVFPQLAAGATIVLVDAAIFALSVVFGPARGVWHRWRRGLFAKRGIACDDLLRTCYESAENEVRRTHGRVPTLTPELLTQFGLSESEIAEARAWGSSSLARALTDLANQGLLRRDSGGLWRLTANGASAAIAAVRNHRLWELYLIHYAAVAPAFVDQTADQIEHAVGPALLDELQSLLAQSLAGEAAVPAAMPASPHGEVGVSGDERIDGVD